MSKVLKALIMIVFILAVLGIVYLLLPECAPYEYKGNAQDICIAIPRFKVYLFNIFGYKI